MKNGSDMLVHFVLLVKRWIIVVTVLVEKLINGVGYTVIFRVSSFSITSV